MVEKKESGFVRWLKGLTKRQIRVGFAIYFVGIFMFFLFPPLFKVVNRVYPLVWGMPFIVFSSFLSWVLIALGLNGLFEVENIRRDFK